MFEGTKQQHRLRTACVGGLIIGSTIRMGHYVFDIHHVKIEE